MQNITTSLNQREVEESLYRKSEKFYINMGFVKSFLIKFLRFFSKKFRASAEIVPEFYRNHVLARYFKPIPVEHID